MRVRSVRIRVVYLFVRFDITDFCKKGKEKGENWWMEVLTFRDLPGSVVSHLCKDAVYKTNEKYFSLIYVVQVNLPL